MKIDLRRNDGAFLTVLVLLGSFLLFAHLGDRSLWQDEAETALLAQSVLVHGIPTAFDGRNLVSQESQAELTAESHRWFWTPWMQHYLAAGSFAAFGPNTWAARLPFAALGLGCLLLTYQITLRLTGDRRAARMAALLLLVSVPFLLHMRQCRYYAPATFFSLLLVHQYLDLLAGRPRAPLGLAVSAIGLFHSQYVICGALFAATTLHLLWLGGEPSHRRRFAMAWIAAGLLCAPWALLFASKTSSSAFPGLRRGLRSLARAVDLLNRAVLPAALVVAATLFRSPPEQAMPPERRREVALLPIILAIGTLTLAFVMPWFFFRYYVVLIPFGACLQGILLARLWSSHRPLAAMLLVLAAGTDLLPRALPYRVSEPASDIRYLRTGDEDPTRVVGDWARFSPIAAYLYEITHDVTGPIEVLAAYLNEHGSPSDTVIATYGDLPLQFHTPMHVVGGLSGVDPTPHREAEWIVVRTHTHRRGDALLKRQLETLVDWDRYEEIQFEVLDVPYENRPDPSYHKYRTVREGVPPLRLLRRRNDGADQPVELTP